MGVVKMSYCKNLKTGKPLSIFHSKSEARKYAKQNRAKHRKLVPYRCTHCDYWHVRSRKNDEHYRVCNCKDHKRRPKRAYLDLGVAEVTRDKINAARGVTVKIYECPEYYDLWHLTGQK